MRKKLLAATLLTSATFSTALFAAEHVVVDGAWIRSAPPGVAVMAAYLRLSNHGDKAVTLEKIHSPAFNSVEVHRTTMHNGMMKMEEVKPFVLEARQEAVFEPGALHLMLNKPKQELKRGDSAQITLTFSDKQEVSFEAIVRDGDEEMNMGHGGGHHHH